MNAGVFGGGIYSRRGARLLRMVGKTEYKPQTVKVAPVSRKHVRGKDGKYRPAHVDPYMPDTFMNLHPGGNSACYAIQVAHLLGAGRIFMVGFTLSNGSKYHFDGPNPCTRRQTTFYDGARATAWLSWYQENFPDKVLLDPSFSGTIYNIFREADLNELRGEGAKRVEPGQDRRLPQEDPGGRGLQSDPDGPDAAGQGRPGQDRGGPGAEEAWVL